MAQLNSQRALQATQGVVLLSSKTAPAAARGATRALNLSTACGSL
jgi:hypothetical protein